MTGGRILSLPIKNQQSKINIHQSVASSTDHCSSGTFPFFPQSLNIQSPISFPLPWSSPSHHTMIEETACFALAGSPGPKPPILSRFAPHFRVGSGGGAHIAGSGRGAAHRREGNAALPPLVLAQGIRGPLQTPLKSLMFIRSDARPIIRLAPPPLRPLSPGADPGRCRVP